MIKRICIQIQIEISLSVPIIPLCIDVSGILIINLQYNIDIIDRATETPIYDFALFIYTVDLLWI